MTKVGFLKLVMLFLLVTTAYGQKVKYKDIFALLSTKQYEQAEPFLKRYLKENDDNPNAYLFMGMIFQDKSAKMDVLKQTDLAISSMDTAIFFFDKALKTVDEREVRKNKEYYQAYNRRDLRTGEFGVKQSDVQFDLEKRIEGLKERIDKVKMVRFYFSLSDSLYKQSMRIYASLQKNYASQQQLYLRANENSIKVLEVLGEKMDSCAKAFESYKASAEHLGKIGYNQQWSLKEINDFTKDGVEATSFYNDEVAVWDYKKFTVNALDAIRKDVLPMREHLISYDIEINKLRDRLNTDSVSVRNDLTKLIDKLLYEQLRKFDPEPLPMEVFSLKTSDLEYRSVLLENKPLRDTADVHLRLALVNREMKLLGKIDSIASKLSEETIDAHAKDYEHFVTNTYSSSVVLKSYVKTLKEYASRERRVKDGELANRLKALQWIIDGADSIPLKPQAVPSAFRPLFTVDEKYTMGLHMHDSVNAEGYFYTITAARKPEVKVVFPVDKASFRQSKLPVVKGLSFAEGGGQLFFVLVYSEQLKNEKHNATLAKIYRSDGLAWSNNYQLTFIPKEITLKPDTGEVTLKSDAQQIVIDKNGKLLR